MQDSIFTKIVNGELPCHKIFEDELTLAFLDIHPLLPGHTLVISKEQFQFVWDLPPHVYSAVMETSRRVALRLREVMDAPYIHSGIVGVDVPHAHVHLIPFSNPAQLREQQDMSAEPDHAALAALASILKF
jgi:histidine triad (HIT) family protein